MPVLAVVGADHQIIRSTETFRLKCESSVAMCERSAELDLVLTGQTDNAVLDLGDFRLSIEAVTDAAGKRQAMLSLPAEDVAAEDDAPLAALREAADDSPAIVWAKDLDGRYLYANARYELELEVSEERLLGNTDADLPPVETVDGPRLRYADDGLKEPLQLEYNVPALDSRPPMVAFRFPLRNGRGQPVGTCGVAAPAGKSQIARDEAVRLMQLERWNRLDPVDVRAELLEQWHVQARPGPVEEAEPEPEVKAHNGRAKLFSRRAPAEEPAGATAPLEEVQAPVTPAEPVPADPEPDVPADPESVEAELDPAPPAETEAPERSLNGAEPAHQREDEWVRQLRQAAAMTSDASGSDTAGALHSDLQLARKWAERANQLQGDLHEANARILAAEAETQHAIAGHQQASAEAQQACAELEQARTAALLAAEEQARLRAELEQLRAELDREQRDAHQARSEIDAAQRELEAARAQADSLRAPADAALKLSEELERALAAEQERGDELARTLGRIRARLGDLDGAAERAQVAPPPRA